MYTLKYSFYNNPEKHSETFSELSEATDFAYKNKDIEWWEVYDKNDSLICGNGLEWFCFG